MDHDRLGDACDPDADGDGRDQGSGWVRMGSGMGKEMHVITSLMISMRNSVVWTRMGSGMLPDKQKMFILYLVKIKE